MFGRGAGRSPLPGPRGAGLAAASALLVLLVGASTVDSSAGAQQEAATHRVIVVFKDQVEGMPASRKDEAARRRVVQRVQEPVLSQLTASRAGDVHAYTVLDALSATVSPNEEASLKANPAVSEVVTDQIIHLAPPHGAASGEPGEGTKPLPGACASKGKVQLDPQALETIHADSEERKAATARSLGLDGSGVTVAFIADGLETDNPDFIRANGEHVFVDYKDFSGEGTGVATGGGEAFLDASSVAAQGRQVYDISHYSALPLNQPCRIRVEGVAPGASLVGLDIFGAENAGFNSSFLQAIDYAVSVDHVQVLNESLGNNFYPDDEASLDLIKRANDAAVAAGTTVTVSSGDAGVTSTIGTPATDPNVIAVGASTTRRINAQTGYGGARFPGVSGWLDDNISSFSSGGFEQDGRTVDLVAPGELNWALCSTDTAMYNECSSLAGDPTPVQESGGTSESAPLTAGVAALVIEAYRTTHGGASPSPALVKQIITSSADDIDAPADQQGAGRLDAYKAALAAESVTAPHAVGDTLLMSAGQLNAVDQAGTPETLSDQVTNTGAVTQKLSVSSRTLGAYRTVKSAQLELSDSASPHMADWQGVSDNYEPVTFRVPSGQDRLDAAIAFQGPAFFEDPELHGRVRLTLIDPHGKLAAYSVPQGDGNYGDVQVASPAGGTWTAYVYSRNSGAAGTTGPVSFAASVARYEKFGHVSPSTLTLAPGQTRTVTLETSTPTKPGDQAGSIVLTSNSGAAFGRVSTIAVTLRSLMASGSESFTGTLSGGNGRAFFTGQEFYYQLDVAPGRPELNAAVTLANNANNPFDAWLVSPSGEELALAANTLPTETEPGYVNEPGAQLHVLSPAAGRWTLIIAFVPQVSGTAISEQFTVSSDQEAVVAHAPGLPDSPHRQLAAGVAKTVDVTVHNSGPGPEAYFVDARQPKQTQLELAPLGGASTTEPITVSSNIPVYLVPTHTTTLTESASTTGTQPIQFDSSSPEGDPDIGSSVGLTASASFAAPQISQGIWDILPQEVGPFGAEGGPEEPVETAMSVTTQAFDPAVTSSTGDLWLAASEPELLESVEPLVVNPGETATIPVTITPSATASSTVSGTLYVDDADLTVFQVFHVLQGNEVAAIPYSYTVG